MADIAQLAEDRDALICHGSPPSDVRSFFPEPADDEAELLDGVRHRARRVRPHPPAVPPRSAVRGIELINPGSVGLPFDGDTRAAYALVHPRPRGRAPAGGVRPRVGRRAAAGIDEAWSETVARRIEQARPDV